ncbi:MAG TPA: iron chelate uptake ABC transporter family permease subunit, partial [Devosia sp.]|nr:iron chelate uptake ABC transporter family permease subunit [Devosia sp.]
FIVAGLALAVVAGRSLNAIALGDDVARSLGTKLGLTRVVTVAAITLLCGAAVAAAGPISFVGLVVPHVARAWCGADQRWQIAYSALLGPMLLIGSDIVGRIILPPGEVQVGIMTAIIGGPLFVAIVRKIRLAQL